MNQEDKNWRFKRLGTQRTQEVLERIRILGNCADTRTYGYTDDQIDRVFRAIEDQLKTVKAKFKKTKIRFNL